jgi:hypothetical protein
MGREVATLWIALALCGGSQELAREAASVSVASTERAKCPENTIDASAHMIGCR